MAAGVEASAQTTVAQAVEEAEAEAGAQPALAADLSRLRPQGLRGLLRRHRRLAGAYLLLSLAGAAAIALAVHYDSGPSPARSSWSGYAPRATSESGAERLAAHADETTLAGKPRYAVLADVVGAKRIEGQYSLSSDVQAVAVEDGRRVDVLRRGTAVYALCGTLTSCVLDPPTATYARGVRIRRQALTVALYSLKYIGVEQVVVVLPPRLDGTRLEALLFRRQDWADALREPLAKTLPEQSVPPRAAPPPTSVPAEALDARVLAHRYRLRSQPTSAHSLLLLLDQRDE